MGIATNAPPAVRLSRRQAFDSKGNHSRASQYREALPRRPRPGAHPIKSLFGTVLAVSICAAPTPILASGYALSEQSVSGMGTAFAGRSSAAEDATTLFGNPAGMSHLQHEQVAGGFALIDAHTDIEHASGSFPGSNDGDQVPFSVVPLGYYIKPLDERWTFGVGAYVPFGLVTDYEGSFQGRYYANRSEVKVYTLQPTLSYRLNDRLSIGFGPTFNYVKGELSSALLNPLSPGRNDGRIKIEGDDVALGYNLGVLYEITPQTRVGLTYHSRVVYHLEGHTRISGPGPVLGSSAGRYRTKLDLTTPEMLELSLTQQLGERWTLYAGSTWTRWSRQDAIIAENRGVGGLLAPNLGTVSEEQDWHNTWLHAIGVAFRPNPRWMFRAGFALDQTPIRNEHRSPRIPNDDRRLFGVGLAWTPHPDLTLDLAYIFVHEKDARLARSVRDHPAQGSYNATYDNSANLFGAQLNYRF